MSQVFLMVIKGNRIFYKHDHWRKIKQMLEQKNFDEANYLDAGYILIDENRGIVVNEQDAFGL